MHWENNGTIRSDWNFDTIKSTSVMGTFRSVARDLLQERDEDEYIEEMDDMYDEDENWDGSMDTGGAVKGSDPLGGHPNAIGMNPQAAHSTVIIRGSPDGEEEVDIPALMSAAEANESSLESGGPATPRGYGGDGDYDDEIGDEDAPMDARSAYGGSMRSTRRSSYAARSNVRGAGTIMREADLGTGVDTIRPVKKVDTAGSLRLSAEYVGSSRAREEGASSPTSPTPSKDRPSAKRRVSQQERGGKALVDDVVIPVLQNAISDDMDAREIESLSMLARGFADLRDANPALSYNVILDILSGINENHSVRQHIHTSRGLFPHKRVIRRSEMTTKGLVVTEEQEEISGLPQSSSPTPYPASMKSDESSSTSSPSRKSPIAELLYMRWLEGLKIKWPSILSSSA